MWPILSLLKFIAKHKQQRYPDEDVKGQRPSRSSSHTLSVDCGTQVGYSCRSQALGHSPCLCHHFCSPHPALSHSLGINKLLVHPGRCFHHSLCLSSPNPSQLQWLLDHITRCGAHVVQTAVCSKHLWIQWCYWKADDNGNYIRIHSFALSSSSPVPSLLLFVTGSSPLPLPTPAMPRMLQNRKTSWACAWQATGL